MFLIKGPNDYYRNVCVSFYIEPRNGNIPCGSISVTRVGTAAVGESWLPAFYRAVFVREFAEGGNITSEAVIAEFLRGRE
jgi:hypothetical protein